MNEKKEDYIEKEVPQELQGVQDWVKEQLDIEAVAAEVVRLEESQVMEKRLRNQIRRLHKQLFYTTAILRKIIVDHHLTKQFPESINSEDRKVEEKKRQILIGFLDDPSFRIGLGLRVSPTVSNTENKTGKITKEDCDSRRDICKTACCRYTFALTESEIGEKEIGWSLERPFMVDVGKDGYCIHLDRNTLKCLIYDKRPIVCRNFSCQKDKRIWEDYDQKDLAPALANTLKNQLKEDRGKEK